MTLNPVALAPFLLLAVFVIWRIWFRKERTLGSLKGNWRTILNQKVSFYADLAPTEKPRFEQEVLYFFDNVTITGVEIEIDDTDRLLVAASAVIPLFGFPELRYRNINEVLLYKGNFNADNQTEGKGLNTLGKVGSGDMNRLMILSLPALHSGFEIENSTSNAVSYTHLTLPTIYSV